MKIVCKMSLREYLKADAKYLLTMAGIILLSVAAVFLIGCGSSETEATASAPQTLQAKYEKERARINKVYQAEKAKIYSVYDAPIWKNSLNLPKPERDALMKERDMRVMKLRGQRDLALRQSWERYKDARLGGTSPELQPKRSN